jgi:hypothetical protein
MEGEKPREAQILIPWSIGRFVLYQIARMGEGSADPAYVGALAWLPELFSDSDSLAEEGEMHVRCLGFGRVGSGDGAAVRCRQGCPFADKVGHHLQ